MGCDIHLRLEIKSKKIEKSKWEPCRIFGYGRNVWSEQDYRMFSVLADVRNDSELPHLPLRGLPHDAAKETLRCYGFVVATKAEYDWQVSEEDAERWVRQGLSHYYEIDGMGYCSDPDAHSPNWCTTQEMEDCVNRVFVKNDGTYECGYIEWLALLGTMKGYEQSGGYECRAVFWFDS